MNPNDTKDPAVTEPAPPVVNQSAQPNLNTSQINPEKPVMKKNILIISAAIVAVLIIVGIILFIRSSSNKSSTQDKSGSTNANSSNQTQQTTADTTTTKIVGEGFSFRVPKDAIVKPNIGDAAYEISFSSFGLGKVYVVDVKPKDSDTKLDLPIESLLSLNANAYKTKTNAKETRRFSLDIPGSNQTIEGIEYTYINSSNIPTTARILATRISGSKALVTIVLSKTDISAQNNDTIVAYLNSIRVPAE
jgi:hypothetical protein